MVATQFVSWHPLVSNCVAVAAGTKLNILELDEKNTNVSPLETPSISCVDWKHSSALQLAYGTSTGNVVILNPGRGDETILATKRSCNSVCWNHLDKHKVAVGQEGIKGSDSSMFVWDLEHDVTLKLPIAETCSAIVWHADHPQQLLFGNAMGTVRLVDLRIHHTASSSASSSAVYSLQAHSATRPRRIRGIRVNPLLSHVAATFSDAAGDVVKLWDLRALGSSSSMNNNKSIPLLTVFPYTSSNHAHQQSTGLSTAGYVSDVAWSPRSAFTVATATSCQSAVHIFRCDTSSNSSSSSHVATAELSAISAASSNPSIPSPIVPINTQQPHSANSPSLFRIPDVTIPLSEPAKAISWQGNMRKSGYYRDLLLTSNTDTTIDYLSLTTPTSYPRENMLSLRMSDGNNLHQKEDGIWESSRAEDRRHLDHGEEHFSFYHRQYQSNIGCALVKNDQDRDCFGLLAIGTTQGVTIAPSHTETASAVSYTTGYAAIGDNIRRHVVVAPCESLCRATSLGDYMTASAEDRQRDRALAGYGTDLTCNIEILTEEASMLSSTIAKMKSSPNTATSTSGIGMVPNSTNAASALLTGRSNSTVANICDHNNLVLDAAAARELLKLKRALVQVQELQRVWQWLSRLLSAIQATTPSTSALVLLQSGARGLMRHLQASTPFIPTTRSQSKMPIPSAVITSQMVFNRELGLMLYTSKARADILSLLCGWPATSSTSASSSSSSSSVGLAVEVSSSTVTGTPVSLECQAVRLLWRGQIDQAVSLLLSGLNAGVNKKSAGPGSGFMHHHHHGNMSNPLNSTSAQYEQLVELTAECLSGYQPNIDSYSFTVDSGSSSTSSLEQFDAETSLPPPVPTVSLHLRKEISDSEPYYSQPVVNAPSSTLSPSRKASYLHAQKDSAAAAAHMSQPTDNKMTAWARMVRHTLDRWQLYANSARHHAMLQPPTVRISLPIHRTNQIYLRAVLQFLLVAETHSCTLPSSKESSLHSGPEEWNKQQSKRQSQIWRQFLQDSDIMQQIPFLDRLAFASIFLHDDDYFAWIDSQLPSAVHQKASSKSAATATTDAMLPKSLEALALVGLETSDSVALLQSHVDHCDDLQSVALLSVCGVFRQRNSALTVHGPSPSLGNTASVGSTTYCGTNTASSSLLAASSNNNLASNALVSAVDIDRMLTRWVLHYRALLVNWEMVSPRVALDEAINTQSATFPYVFFTNYQGYDNYGGRRTPAFIDACTVFKTADALPKDLVKKHMAVSALRLRCTYCGSALPPLHQLIDLWKQKQREIGRLKNEKKVLNFCIKCAQRQHLPRCYVCHLFVGMLNPYRLVESLTEQGKQQKDAILSAQRQWQQQQSQQAQQAQLTNEPTYASTSSTSSTSPAAAATAASASVSATGSPLGSASSMMMRPNSSGPGSVGGGLKSGYPHARPPPHQGSGGGGGGGGMGGGGGGGPPSSAASAAYYHHNRMMLGRGGGGPPPRPPALSVHHHASMPPSSASSVSAATSVETPISTTESTPTSSEPTTPRSQMSDNNKQPRPALSTNKSGNNLTAQPASLINSSSSSSSSSSNTSSSHGSSNELAAAALANVAREQRDKDKNGFNDLALPFDDWLLYCQRCRHGGHSVCLRRWFSRMLTSAEVQLDHEETYASDFASNLTRSHDKKKGKRGKSQRKTRAGYDCDYDRRRDEEYDDDDDQDDGILEEEDDDVDDDGVVEEDDEDEEDANILLCYPTAATANKRKKKSTKFSNNIRKNNKSSSSATGSATKGYSTAKREVKRQICGVNGCDCQCDLSFE